SYCKQVKPFIDRMEKKYKDKINFQRYELGKNQENIDLFIQFLDAYGVPLGQGAVPVVFIGSVAIMERVNIEMYLESVIASCVLETCRLENNLDDTVGGLISIKSSSRGKLSIPLIVGAAIVDSINPCAIAVLLFLVAFLLTIRATKRRMILVGGVYILTVMSVYIAAGFGILQFVSHFDLGRTLNYIAAGILIFAGLLSVKDFWWPNKGISLKIPDIIKPKIEKYLTNATIPSVIVAGILVAIFELPCTGEVYLGILSLMSQESQSLTSVFYLVLYNFIFVLPLLIILILAASGLNIERIEQVRFERRRWLKLLLGLGMLILATWLLL
ncbi:MAG: cytochrome c biogenesis protein CcdA, partial [Patescibacteria group bacterium]|nr:cytochrome c biogenesis protein CcdA [Patescibacteria group bacterium]